MAEAERSARDDGAAAAARARLRRCAARAPARGCGTVQRRLRVVPHRTRAWRKAGRGTAVPGARRQGGAAAAERALLRRAEQARAGACGRRAARLCTLTRDCRCRRRLHQLHTLRLRGIRPVARAAGGALRRQARRGAAAAAALLLGEAWRRDALRSVAGRQATHAPAGEWVDGPLGADAAAGGGGMRRAARPDAGQLPP